jgi:hypothetical protein
MDRARTTKRNLTRAEYFVLALQDTGVEAADFATSPESSGCKQVLAECVSLAGLRRMPES